MTRTAAGSNGRVRVFIALAVVAVPAVGVGVGLRCRQTSAEFGQFSRGWRNELPPEAAGTARADLNPRVQQPPPHRRRPDPVASLEIGHRPLLDRIQPAQRRRCRAIPAGQRHGVSGGHHATLNTAERPRHGDLARRQADVRLLGNDGGGALSGRAGRWWPDHELRMTRVGTSPATDKQRHLSTRTPRARHFPTRLVA